MYKDDEPERRWLLKVNKDADGAKLINLYQTDNALPKIYGSEYDNETDFVIYYETNDTYNSFGSICFIKLSDQMRALLAGLNYGSGWRDWLVREIVSHREYSDLNTKKLREAIDYEVETGGWGYNIGKVATWLLRKVADGIRDLKMPPERWDSNLENQVSFFYQ